MKRIVPIAALAALLAWAPGSALAIEDSPVNGRWDLEGRAPDGSRYRGTMRIGDGPVQVMLVTLELEHPTLPRRWTGTAVLDGTLLRTYVMPEHDTPGLLGELRDVNGDGAPERIRPWIQASYRGEGDRFEGSATLVTGIGADAERRLVGRETLTRLSFASPDAPAAPALAGDSGAHSSRKTVPPALSVRPLTTTESARGPSNLASTSEGAGRRRSAQELSACTVSSACSTSATWV